jgi:hypothetical protein
MLDSQNVSRSFSLEIDGAEIFFMIANQTNKNAFVVGGR